MSKRMWIGLLLCLGASAAYAETPQNAMRLGDSRWTLYRPDPRSPAIFDIDYMMNSLRSDVPGYSLRFSESLDFTFELKFAPPLDRDDFVGPVYDMDIGATRLIFSFRF